MRALKSLLALSAVAAAVTAGTGSAAAVDRCFGLEGTAVVCTSTPSVRTRHQTECVYAGGDTCTEVDVLVPYLYGDTAVWCTGSVFDFTDPRIC
jgi:hypothetical protein